MKTIKLKEVKECLINAGASYKRPGKGSHEIWTYKNKTLALPLHREVSPGTLRDIQKIMEVKIFDKVS